MKSDRLQIVSVEQKKTTPRSSSRTRTNREEVQGRFERLWHLTPSQFNPMRNSIERERLNRSFSIIASAVELKGKNIVDLGCGSGELSQRLRDAGAQITAVDIAKNALQKVAENGDDIHIIQDCLPSTKLPDDSFDIVICTDVIAYLRPNEQRLLMSELARLMKPDGIVVCSTPTDIYSIDALEKFTSLATTEFAETQWLLSYHRYLIQCKNFWNAPKLFAQAGKDADYRTKEIRKRQGLNKWWFQINSHKITSTFWHIVSFLTTPLSEFINQHTPLMLFLEKVCRFIQSEVGISHALFIGKRRPLIAQKIETPIHNEIRRKKPVWE